MTTFNNSNCENCYSTQRRDHILGMLGVVLIIVFYNYFFIFSFLPLTEGWFSAYAHLILDGQMPYKDFYLYLTPFYPMLLAAIIGLFGESFFVLRVFGLIIIVFIAITLYKILAKRFSPPAAMIATVVATLYYQSGVAHIPYDFTQILTLFTLLSAWMLVEAESARGLNCTKNLLDLTVIHRVFLAGLFASFAFLTKQSNGAFVVVATAMACGYLSLSYGKHYWKLIVVFAGGCLLPVVMTVLWLFYIGALSYFWAQIFGGAVSAKGSLYNILFSWVSGLFTTVYVSQIIFVCKLTSLVILLSFFLRGTLGRIDISISIERRNLVFIFFIFLLCLITVVNALFDSSVIFGVSTQFSNQVINHIIPIGVTLSIILVIISLIGLFIPIVKSYVTPVFSIIGIVSTGMIWGNGTSAGLSEVGVFAIYGLYLAVLIDMPLFRYAGFTMGLLLSVSLIFTFSSRKYDQPYAWWGVSEPDIRTASYFSRTPIAIGLTMSQTTAENLDQLSHLLLSAPQQGDIFAFPNIPLVYLIANRWPNSKVVVPWFDFLPDLPAKDEANRIFNTPPATIINLKLPSAAWDAHERLFRNGGSLGQKDILSAIEELTERRRLYTKEFSREVSKGCVLEVWYKKQ